MQFDMIMKIALGVFLGMAAWTYRADIGTISLYFFGFFILAYIFIWCYRAIEEPITVKLRERKVEILISELQNQNLIEHQIVSALRFGLINNFFDEDFNLISISLTEFKKDLQNGGSGDLYKGQILKIVNEVVERFKQSDKNLSCKFH